MQFQAPLKLEINEIKHKFSDEVDGFDQNICVSLRELIDVTIPESVYTGRQVYLDPGMVA